MVQWLLLLACGETPSVSSVSDTGATGGLDDDSAVSDPISPPEKGSATGSTGATGDTGFTTGETDAITYTDDALELTLTVFAPDVTLEAFNGTLSVTVNDDGPSTGVGGCLGETYGSYLGIESVGLEDISGNTAGTLIFTHFSGSEALVPYTGTVDDTLYTMVFYGWWDFTDDIQIFISGTVEAQR